MGLLYLVVGVNYLFMPGAQQEYLSPEFWQSFAEQPLSGYVQSIAFALIALLALGLMPVVTTIAGILGAAAFWTELAGNVLQSVPLISAASISAIILGPVWFFWMGFFIRKNADSLDPGYS